jgi:2-methylisocitrate lyase-like PEP mutase family enzyme
MPQDIPITPITRISKRPSKPKPTLMPVAPVAANQTSAATKQPPTFAWLGIIGAVVLLVCFMIWRKRSAAAKEQVNELKRKEQTRRVSPR